MSKIEEIKDFIKKHSKKDSVDKITEDLKTKSFALEKRKLKKKKNKPIKSKLITRKEKKALGYYHVPVKGLNYEQLQPMNDLWQAYMRQHLELHGKPPPDIQEKSWSNFSMAVYKADYHGASVSVTESKCPSLIGITGLIIMETKNTFKVISKDNKVRVIPKEGSAFTFHLDEFDFKMYGKQIARKPAEKSVKVSKLFSLAEL